MMHQPRLRKSASTRDSTASGWFFRSHVSANSASSVDDGPFGLFAYAVPFSTATAGAFGDCPALRSPQYAAQTAGSSGIS